MLLVSAFASVENRYEYSRGISPTAQNEFLGERGVGAVQETFGSRLTLTSSVVLGGGKDADSSMIDSVRDSNDCATMTPYRKVD